MTKYKIKAGDNLIIHQSKKHDINWTLVPEDDITRWMLEKVLEVVKEGQYDVSIECMSLNIGEIELKNITLIIFGSGKIILRNEEIEISGYYKVNRRESKEN
ncbi:hypothetical protein NQ830_12285 [Clostridioides difficile]|uniref:hypothetical protein n=1 Tax=Clostridioides difficile TaxID=1496 RepID=UPI00038CD594|nr:hypothetical protein [Clostridioides difficile]EQJ88694.1 hypothetical protein QUC_3326 [Clostridioides difficile P50]MCO8835438.1 hypothetical protein [Clostridioides difficile]MCR1410110.1 hypothetical protein [Clostridioides difficile]MCR1421098.1 hypothetical protein [Clostridioides difficile]MDI0326373.1 hypothetical protein [Clostridioides difficile]